MAKKQTAKFFCENCGSEVPQSARVCKHCGKFFSSVRCPVCGTTGTAAKFTNGCPNCGYALGNGQEIDAPDQKENHASRKSKKALLNAIDSRNRGYKLPKNVDGTLPVWSFFVILLFLGVAIISGAKYLGML